MTIRREDIDTGQVDFSDVAGPQRVPLTHPGTMLAKQYLKPLRITPYRLAKDIKVPLNRITAKATGRTKTFYVREAILEHLEDLEDLYLAEREVKAVRAGKSKTVSLEKLMKQYGLED